MVCFIKDPEVLVTYTGGICGTFILFIFPICLVRFARDYKNKNDKEGFNFNQSPFASVGFQIVIALFSITTLFFVILGIVKGNAGK